MKRTLLAVMLIVALIVNGCGGGGGGSSSATSTPKSFTAVEEAEFSEGYTELGVAYYELVIKFNRFAAFDTPVSESDWNNWLAALDDAVAAADAAEAYHAVVAAYDFSAPANVSAALSASRAVSSNTTKARKLLNLYESGNGPERLTLQYISDKTGKSIKFLKALLNQVKSQKDSEQWADKADKYDRAAKSCEFVRDTAITVNSALVTVASGPLAVAGNFSKLVQGASTIKKIWTGTKVAYEVYSAGKLIDDVANKGARLVIGIGTGDIPPQIPTLSETILKKTGLDTLDTSVSLVTGISGAISGNWGERAAVITDTLKTGFGFFQGSDSESGGVVTQTSSDALESHFTADNKLVDSKLDLNQAMKGEHGSAPTTNDKLAAQVGAGTYKSSYVENTQISTVIGDTADDVAGLNRSTGMRFEYDGVADKTTINWDGDGDGNSDFIVDVDGTVDVKDDTGVYETTGTVDVTLDKKQEQIVVTAPSSNNFNADTLLQNAWSAAPTPAPVALDSLSGSYDGRYTCTEDAAGLCDFWVTGQRIYGWFRPDVNEPQLEFDGMISSGGGFEVFGEIPASTEPIEPDGNTFDLSGGIYQNMDLSWDLVNVWVTARDYDGWPLVDECLSVHLPTCDSNDPMWWATVPVIRQ